MIYRTSTNICKLVFLWGGKNVELRVLLAVEHCNNLQARQDGWCFAGSDYEESRPEVEQIGRRFLFFSRAHLADRKCVLKTFFLDLYSIAKMDIHMPNIYNSHYKNKVAAREKEEEGKKRGTAPYSFYSIITLQKNTRRRRQPILFFVQTTNKR